MDLTVADFRILYMRGIDYVAPHPIKTQTYQDYMGAENNNRELVLAILSQDTCREGDEADEHEKEGVDICELGIDIFRIY